MAIKFIRKNRQIGVNDLFENILGNDKIKNELINSVKQNKYSHSYLFLGTSGIGKRLIAREFAKMILCEGEEKYCGKCKSCLEFDSNNNPDFLEIEPDGNNVKIEQIREMQRKIAEQPIISEKKVYIINEADTMTREAQNCLLKTLEEPPEFANIILIGANEANFLSTIKSRCTIIKFNNIPDEEIKKYLEQKYELENVPKSIILASSGSIGKAEIIKDKQELYSAVDEVINNIEKMDLIDTLKKADIIYKLQEDKNEILEYINIVLFKKAKQNTKYLNCINIVEDAKKRLKANSNYNMTIDNMIMTIWEEIH